MFFFQSFLWISVCVFCICMCVCLICIINVILLTIYIVIIVVSLCTSVMTYIICSKMYCFFSASHHQCICTAYEYMRVVREITHVHVLRSMCKCVGQSSVSSFIIHRVHLSAYARRLRLSCSAFVYTCTIDAVLVLSSSTRFIINRRRLSIRCRYDNVARREQLFFYHTGL